MKLKRSQLKFLLESLLNENNKDLIQQSLAGKLKANGVTLDTKLYIGMRIVSGEYLGSIDEKDVKKLGQAGLRAIIQQTNKKYNTSIKTVQTEGAHDSQGNYIPDENLYFGIGNLEIELPGD